MSIEAMKQALEVIEAAIESGDWQIDGACDPSMAIHSLYEAIAEAEKQEPVAFVSGYYGGQCVILPIYKDKLFSPGTALYTAPVHAIDISQERVDETAKHRHEPIAWLSKCYNDDNEFLGYTLWDRDVGEECFPVYTASSKREWVGLTDEEVWGLVAFEGASLADFVKHIEAKLKEKNS